MTKNIDNKFSQEEKPFLFSNQERKLPDIIEKGEKITNEYGRNEIIQKVNQTGEKIYFQSKTNPAEGDGVSTIRNYELKGNKPVLLNQHYEDSESYKNLSLLN